MYMYYIKGRAQEELPAHFGTRSVWWRLRSRGGRLHNRRFERKSIDNGLSGFGKGFHVFKKFRVKW